VRCGGGEEETGQPGDVDVDGAPGSVVFGGHAMDLDVARGVAGAAQVRCTQVLAVGER